jgi:hypothetical protein
VAGKAIFYSIAIWAVSLRPVSQKPPISLTSLEMGSLSTAHNQRPRAPLSFIFSPPTLSICPIHPKIARHSHPIIPNPVSLKTGLQELRALLPAPLSLISTPPALSMPLLQIHEFAACAAAQALVDKSPQTCQSRQRGAA